MVAAAGAEERRNWFDDPFEQATSGMRGCPAPDGPLLTESEQRREAHARIERGTSCWLAGKCDAPNAYRSDLAINAAAAARLRAEPRLHDTSLWTITQRRFVFVQGCVRSRAQIGLIFAAVKADPRVDHVGDELLIGTQGKPPYTSSAAAASGAGAAR